MCLDGEEPESIDDCVDCLSDDLVSSTDEATPIEHIWLLLHHVHLPKLDAVDIIEYHPEDHSVRVTVSTQVAALVESIEATNAHGP